MRSIYDPIEKKIIKMNFEDNANDYTEITKNSTNNCWRVVISTKGGWFYMLRISAIVNPVFCLIGVLCMSRWAFRLDRWLKVLLHTLHLCGGSSLCMILCTAKVLAWQNPLPQILHLKGFSFEWIYLKQKRDKKAY